MTGRLAGDENPQITFAVIHGLVRDAGGDFYAFAGVNYVLRAVGFHAQLTG